MWGKSSRKAEGARKPVSARFWRDRRGSTAVEFVLLIMPFSLLVFAILECGVSFAAQEVLANATDDVARMIRTGQFKGTAVTKATLKTMICDRIEIIVPTGCPGLEVDLRKFDTFQQAADMKIPYTATGDLDSSDSALKVEAGNSMTKNMLRVFYRWPVMTDIMASRLSNLPQNKTLHFATVTWQNEPFDD